MLARFGFYSYLCGMEKDCDINPNTDFGLKKLFEQAEIARTQSQSVASIMRVRRSIGTIIVR